MKYNCKKCINNGSGLCRYCYQITSPGGEEAPPTYYVENKQSSDVQGTEEHKLLQKALEEGRPLPMAVVIRYNERIGGRNDKA